MLCSLLQAAATEAAHRRAMKAALNSCVRLCVVAPTVNINLDDSSRSFCSGLPEAKIRAFVEKSVLPRFTRVLLQPGVDTTAVEASSPQHKLADDDAAVERDVARAREQPQVAGGGRDGDGVNNGQGDFDRWLRDLLVDMQTSIERHVASVFQTQTAVTGALVTRRQSGRK